MTQKLARSLSAMAILLFMGVSLAFLNASPASALQPAEVQDQSTYSSVAAYVSEGEAVYLGAGAAATYDVSGMMDESYYGSQIKRVKSSASSRATCSITSSSGRITVRAKRAGKVTVSFVETWSEDGKTQSAKHSFVVNVVSLANKSGLVTKTVTESSYTPSATFTFKISGLPETASVSVLSDSVKNGFGWIEGQGAGTLSFRLYYAGTHVIKFKACGKIVTVKASLRVLKMKPAGTIKYTNSLTAFAGMSKNLGVKLTGVKSPKAKWSSSDSSVAKVNKKGVVRAKKVGRCTISAKVGDATVGVLVEVVPKKAYKAVIYGFRDMETNIVYSQAERMGKNKRDCSSFVSRCYWDESLGRRSFLIGGSGAKFWAYNAAAQAKWLMDTGRRVASKACSVKKLRPGDTVYYETDYNGKDASQWRYIDHAGLYVGNGYVLNTGGWGGKGSVGLRWYSEADSSIKFIGRPIK